MIAWAEPESPDDIRENQAQGDEEGCPTAEEEARLFLDQKAYFDSIDDHPFDFNDHPQGEEDLDDAANFWAEIPTEAAAASQESRLTGEESSPSQKASDSELARELFGYDLDAPRQSRRKTTANAQGQRFWNSLDDFDAPNGKRISDLRLTPVEELFDPLDDLASGAASSTHDPAITAEEPQQQPTSLPVLDASLQSLLRNHPCWTLLDTIWRPCKTWLNSLKSGPKSSGPTASICKRHACSFPARKGRQGNEVLEALLQRTLGTRPGPRTCRSSNRTGQRRIG